MHDDYLYKKTATKDTGSTSSMKGRNWFPEIIDQEDIGRSYPAEKPLSFLTGLRRLVSK